MTPSVQQQAIFADVGEGVGHMVVQARAGTGKTTTIMAALAHVPQNVKNDVLMVAFNKEIATTLQSRAPANVQVQTLHSFGLRQVCAAMSRQPKIEQYKTSDIISGLVKDRELRGVVGKAISSAKSNLIPLTDKEAIGGLFDDVPLPESVSREGLADIVSEVMRRCADDQTRIDFDDMIWMPNVFDIPILSYKRVFVDETQDLNPAQLRLALKACHKAGRITAVGDDRQAIYGFRGAGKDSLGDVVKGLEAKVLPLTVTYRCAKAIVAEAKKYVPDFSCPETAPDGLVKEVGGVSTAKPGDFILSRTNAPLIKLAFQFVKNNIPVAIAGKDIGGTLRSIIARSKAETVLGLVTYIQKWQEKELARLATLDRDPTAVLDTAECILSLTEGADSLFDISRRIDLLFQERGGDMGSRIVLSSTHKAKGLERDRVFLLRDTFMRRRKGRDGEYQPLPSEEINLYYVAVTRAKRELYLVRGEES